MRIKDDMTKFTGHLFIRANPEYRQDFLAPPPRTRKHPIKMPERRGLYITFDWIIFRTGFDLALHAN